MSVANRRKHDRKKVRVRVTSVEGEKIHLGWTRDVGGGGLCLESEASMEENKTLTLMFYLEKGVRVQAKGQVVWVSDESEKPRLFGFCFKEISEEDRQRVTGFVGRSSSAGH